MSKFRFELNRQGIGELLKCEGMAKAVKEVCDGIMVKTGGASAGYASNVQIHHRAVGMVFTDTAEARADNNENNTLLRALK